MNKWPHDDIKSLLAFYGKPGSSLVYCNPTFEMQTSWMEGGVYKPITKFSVHSKCLDAFNTVFENIWNHVGKDINAIYHYNLHRFGGCFNIRSIRGATRPSVHSFGAAIDINPDGAPMGSRERPSQEQLPDFAIDAFKGQGAFWGG